MAAAVKGCAAPTLLADDVVVLEVAEGEVAAGRRLMTASAPSAPPARPPARISTVTSTVRVPGRPPPCGAGTGGGGDSGCGGPKGSAITSSGWGAHPYETMMAS